MDDKINIAVLTLKNGKICFTGNTRDFIDTIRDELGDDAERYMKDIVNDYETEIKSAEEDLESAGTDSEDTKEDFINLLHKIINKVEKIIKQMPRESIPKEMVRELYEFINREIDRVF